MNAELLEKYDQALITSPYSYEEISDVIRITRINDISPEAMIATLNMGVINEAANNPDISEEDMSMLQEVLNNKTDEEIVEQLTNASFLSELIGLEAIVHAFIDNVNDEDSIGFPGLVGYMARLIIKHHNQGICGPNAHIESR